MKISLNVFVFFFLFSGIAQAATDTASLLPLHLSSFWVLKERTGSGPNTRIYDPITRLTRTPVGGPSVVFYKVDDSTNFVPYWGNDASGFMDYGLTTDFTEDGFTSTDPDDIYYNRGLRLLPPMIDVGQTYVDTVTGMWYPDPFTATSTSTVVARETITGYNGAVLKNVYHVRSTVTLIFDLFEDVNIVTEHWYLPNFGFVRVMSEDGDVADISSGEAYFASGNIRSEMLALPSTGSTIYREFLDENYYGNNTGRLSRQQFLDGGYLTIQHYSGTDLGRRFETYDASGILQIVTEKYLSGNRRFVQTTTADASGYIQYDHLDENWSQNVGRVTKKIRPDLSYVQYTEYWTGTQTPKVEKQYSSTATLIYTQTNYSNGNPESKVYADGRVEEFYEDRAGVAVLIGDVNRDKKVDTADLAALLHYYGTSQNATSVMGDVNYDGKVSLKDVLMLRDHLGDQVPAPAPVAAAMVAEVVENADAPGVGGRRQPVNEELDSLLVMRQRLLKLQRSNQTPILAARRPHAKGRL